MYVNGVSHHELDLDGLQLLGASSSGVGTSIYVPAHGLCLDAGLSFSEQVSCSRLFLTHGHVDHIGALVSLVSWKSLMGNKPLQIYAHPDLLEYVHKIIALSDMAQESHGSLHYASTPIVPGDTVMLTGGREVQCLPAYHRIPSQAYIIRQSKKKLKKELQGKDQKEIEKLALSGVEVSDKHSVDKLAYTGDTTVDIFDNSPALYDVETLVTECTFLQDFSVEEARTRGHIHLDELLKRADLFKNKHLVLTHFSARYHPDDIAKEVAVLQEAVGDTKVSVLLGR